ncbi:exopolysaccharide biosynthesis polyprenyl glycosylphosphotransferase [Sphingomonas sp.]|uniref:exopolysaccharide biosynthesis polyprenyl glycosylphosphotransferase n=1 Tax=Sphingomonas sp. TaxID=28214 RepID=UPI002ED7C021
MNVEAMALRAASTSRAVVRPSHAKLRRRFYFSLLAIDLLCILGSLFLASWVYVPTRAGNEWLIIASLLVPVYLGAALNSHAYSTEIIDKPAVGVRRAVQSVALGFGVILLVAFSTKASADFSRVMVAIAFCLNIVTLAGTRSLALRRARTLLGGDPYSVALIADGDHDLDPHDFSLVIRAGYDIDPQDDSPIMFDRLAAALRHMDRVLVACPPERRGLWVRVLKGANIRSELIVPELEGVAPLALDRCGESLTMVVAEGPLGKFESALKRAFDLMVSIGAITLLAPVMIPVALAIKLTSPGPVLFIQTRIGQGNRLFKMYKFRSMRLDQTDQGGNRSASRGDDRITPIGRVIRMTSIDELPQLLNVLKGEMSIVGPRPHALGSRAEDKLFWEVDGRYWHRHAAKPGLTGLAQIRGFRGATERTSDLTNRLQADLEYLHNWSIWRDLYIILQTVRVLVHRNAY